MTLTDRVRKIPALALPLLVLACDDDGPTAPTAPAPSQLVIMEGDEQAGVPGDVLPDPLVVRAVDAEGQPVQGVEITFAVVAGGGGVDPGAATTGADGTAQATWTLGAAPGTQQVVASVPALDPVQFTAEALNLALCGAQTVDRALRRVAQPYVLCSAGASVTNGATLELEPGVTILAEGGALLRVRSDGSLRAVGTATDTIRFLGTDPTPGSWRGIWHESDADANELAWVEIAHGGGGDYSNLYISHTSQLRVRHSLFRDGADWGLHAASGSVRLPGFEANEFRGNATGGLYIYPQQIRYLDGGSVFAGNGSDRVHVRPGTLDDEPHTWPDPGVPYHMIWVNIDTDVAIEPGTHLIFEDRHDAGIRVRAGSLRAVGRADARIRLTGARPEPGSWNGLWIESAADNELTWVEVAHAGRGDASNLLLSHSGRVTITHSVFRDGSDWGINVTGSGASLPGFHANEILGNARSGIRLFAQHMRYIDGETTLTGNGMDVIEVRPGTLTGEGHVWRQTRAPFYLVNGLSVSADLVVEPGFRLLAADGAQTIRVRTDGSIRAVGTPTGMIRFTAENEQAGAWSALWIESDAANELRYVEVAHGGRGSFHNIHLGSGAALTVTNSIIRNSAQWGIYVASVTSSLTQSQNTFSGNALGNVRTP
jgi:hypothetical protein